MPDSWEVNNSSAGTGGASFRCHSRWGGRIHQCGIVRILTAWLENDQATDNRDGKTRCQGCKTGQQTRRHLLISRFTLVAKYGETSN